MTTVSADPVTEIGPAFKRVLGAMRRLRARERRHPGELRDAQYSLLFSLMSADALSSSELAHLADVTPASATELLDELEASGLVARHRSEHDRRVVLVSLTADGGRLVQARRQQFEPRWRAAFADFTADELSTAVRVLERMRETFERFAEEREQD